MTTLVDNQVPTTQLADTVDVKAGDDDIGVEVQMSVAGGPYGSIHEPIHESLTLSALISSNSGVSPDTTVKNASNHDWEYIRGAIWNDDPDCQLFDDSENQNHSYSLGAAWYKAYRQGETDWNPNAMEMNRLRNPIGRSHYGDLQFLHCMASVRGESPEDTKAKIMVWMEVMYKLVTGEDGTNPDTVVSTTKLAKFCPPMSLPPSWLSLSYYLAKNSNFQGLDIRRRALGSMFHVIQDSYAIGHTKRELINKEDKVSEDPLRFKQGVADRWGPIINFHTYFGQDGDSHSHYDHSSDGVPDPGNLSNLEQWNSLIGCRDAADKCKELAERKNAEEKWDSGFVHEAGSVTITDSFSWNFCCIQAFKMANITINGNTINTNELPAKLPQTAAKTNFILIQTYNRDLFATEKLELAKLGVNIQEYVAQFTYLCRYEKEDLEPIREKDYVKSVTIYLRELKSTISLKDMVEREADRKFYRVDCILHETPNITAEKLAAEIAQKAWVDVTKLAISPVRIRLTVHQDKLEALAKLDSISRIEEVRPDEVFNDLARGTLNADILALSTSYEGNGQKVCVADTGFDQGKMVDELGIQVHPAFIGRVEHLESLWLGDESKDTAGHGTHVCASICGNGLYKNGNVRVQGVAPGATLMVQSIAQVSKDPNKGAIEVPMDLGLQLFSTPRLSIHTPYSIRRLMEYGIWNATHM
ncbi:unnamed protein product, partial [Fusarium langsethiae]